MWTQLWEALLLVLENHVLDYDTSECRGVTLALYKFLTLEERLQKNLLGIYHVIL